MVYADSLKSANEVGAMAALADMVSWNFANAGQRLGRGLWFDVVQRILPDALGFGFLLAFMAAWPVLRSRAFTNPHLADDYYQAANAFPLLVASQVAQYHSGFGLYTRLDGAANPAYLAVFDARLLTPEAAACSLSSRTNPR